MLYRSLDQEISCTRDSSVLQALLAQIATRRERRHTGNTPPVTAHGMSGIWHGNNVLLTDLPRVSTSN